MVEERTFPGPDGGRLTYRELGTGRPVVLLHGFTATGATWFDAGPAHALAERGHRVIVPDLRGHGSSAAPDDPAAYPPDVLTDDLLTLVRHLGLDEETGGYDLAGYSLGGRVVLRALVRGARPRRAVVAGQGLRAVTGPLDQRGLFRRTLDALLAGTPPPLDSPEGGTAAWIRRERQRPARPAPRPRHPAPDHPVRARRRPHPRPRPGRCRRRAPGAHRPRVGRRIPPRSPRGGPR
ncbi:MAG: hypothetical protein QOE59_357 [Actinomycetota bacterium]|nr:hypothetical protein [Actinomycetota bacterium]